MFRRRVLVLGKRGKTSPPSLDAAAARTESAKPATKRSKTAVGKRSLMAASPSGCSEPAVVMPRAVAALPLSFVNAEHRNARSGLLLQSHTVDALLAALSATPELLASGSLESDNGIVWWVSPSYAQSRGAIPRNVEAALGRTSAELALATGIPLPLPSHFCANAELMMENARPRVLTVVNAAFRNPEVVLAPLRPPQRSPDEFELPAAPLQPSQTERDQGEAGTASTPEMLDRWGDPRVPLPTPRFVRPLPLPRDGATARFIVREEVADNLMAARDVLGFRSAVWVHASHPQLGVGANCDLRLMSELEQPILVSLTACAYRFGVDLPLAALEALRLFWHPLFANEASRRPGMNVLTGCVCSNPWCVSPSLDGGASLPLGWIGQGQLKRLRRLLPELESLLDRGAASPSATLIEVDQWSLFNADQLRFPFNLRQPRSVIPARAAQSSPTTSPTAVASLFSTGWRKFVT